VQLVPTVAGRLPLQLTENTVPEVACKRQRTLFNSSIQLCENLKRTAEMYKGHIQRLKWFDISVNGHFQYITESTENRR
jgi:hypothetical protein